MFNNIIVDIFIYYTFHHFPNTAKKWDGLRGKHIVSEVAFSIWWLIPSSPQALPIWRVWRMSFASWIFTSIFDNIACVRGTTFGGSILESLIDVIEQNYWLIRSAFALSSYTNSPDDPLYKGGIV